MPAMNGMGDPAGARPTPYELAFGVGDFEREAFPEIRAEARGRDVDAWEPERFLQLASVGGLLRELLPADAPGAAIREAGQLLYHAYHFWEGGRRGVLLDVALARELLGPLPRIGEWELTPPAPSGYLQLPRSLLWARVDESAPAEPVDGLFWTMRALDDPAAPPYATVDTLLVLGLRPDRPGFSVVHVGAELPGGPGHWGDLEARAPGAGDDFSSVLPGGELSGLRSIVTEAEVLKLLSRCFWYAAVHPGSLVEVEPPADGGAPAVSWSLLHSGARGG